METEFTQYLGRAEKRGNELIFSQEFIALVVSLFILLEMKNTPKWQQEHVFEETVALYKRISAVVTRVNNYKEKVESADIPKENFF